MKIYSDSMIKKHTSFTRKAISIIYTLIYNNLFSIHFLANLFIKKHKLVKGISSMMLLTIDYYIRNVAQMFLIIIPNKYYILRRTLMIIDIEGQSISSDVICRKALKKSSNY